MDRNVVSAALGPAAAAGLLLTAFQIVVVLSLVDNAAPRTLVTVKAASRWPPHFL
jgi:hypothetical protein